MDRWIETNEADDVAASVRHVLRCRQLVSEDVQVWKWIVLALHSAVQGACVCHLVTTAIPVGAVNEKNAGEWIEYFEKSRHDRNAARPKTRILSLPELLKAARKPQSAGDRRNEKGVSLNDEELAWLCDFHNGIRNQFVHFIPRGWAIEISGVPQIGSLIARMIIEMLNIGWAFRHTSEEWRDALRSDLSELYESEWRLD